MNRNQIEARALEIIDKTRKGNREDAIAELKTEFIDPVAMARRLAGHANAAFGEPIYWIIGVNDKTGDVTGYTAQDLAMYWPQVRSCFADDVVPDMTDINLFIEDKTVTVLYFLTDRSPYLIKNPQGGQIQFEVPWREGTMTRTAKRTELLRILSLQTPIPEASIITASILYGQRQSEQGEWRLDCDVYLVPKKNEIVALPFHDAYCDIIVGGDFFGQNVRLHPKELSRDDGAIEVSQAQILIKGPGLVRLMAQGGYRGISPSTGEKVEIVVRFLVAGSTKSVVASTTLRNGKRQSGSINSFVSDMIWTSNP